MDDGISRPDWGPAPSNEPIFIGGKTVSQTSAAPAADTNQTDGSHEANADLSDQSGQQLDAELNPFHEQDAEGTQAASTALRETWGDQFDSNLHSIKGLLSNAPKDFKEAMMSARYNDGRAVANDPKVLTWLASLVPGTSQTGNQSGAGDLHSEIALIESKMGTKEYFRSESMQARLRSLYAARDSQ